MGDPSGISYLEGNEIFEYLGNLCTNMENGGGNDWQNMQEYG